MLDWGKFTLVMTTPHPWNDLEQSFLRFTITVKELAEAIGEAVEDGRVPAEVADRVSNLAIGISAYVTTCEDKIATAMEDKISHDYRTGALQQVSGVLAVDANYTVQLPKHVIELLGWIPGDILEWEVKDGGSVVVRKLDK